MSLVAENTDIKNLTSMYEEKLKKLQIEVSNLESQKKNIEQHEEADWKVDAQKERIRIAEKEKEINKREDSIASSLANLELRETKLAERETALSKREQELINIEKVKSDLDEERSKFRLYKNTVEKDLQKSREEIAENTEKIRNIQVDRDNIEAQKRAITAKEKYIAEIEAVLQFDRENFELYKNNEMERITGGKND